MTDVRDLSWLPQEALHDWVVAQRWFALQDARGRRTSTSIEAVALRDGGADAGAVR